MRFEALVLLGTLSALPSITAQNPTSGLEQKDAPQGYQHLGTGPCLDEVGKAYTFGTYFYGENDKTFKDAVIACPPVGLVGVVDEKNNNAASKDSMYIKCLYTEEAFQDGVPEYLFESQNFIDLYGKGQVVSTMTTDIWSQCYVKDDVEWPELLGANNEPLLPGEDDYLEKAVDPSTTREERRKLVGPIAASLLDLDDMGDKNDHFDDVDDKTGFSMFRSKSQSTSQSTSPSARGRNYNNVNPGPASPNYARPAANSGFNWRNFDQPKGRLSGTYSRTHNPGVNNGNGNVPSWNTANPQQQSTSQYRPGTVGFANQGNNNAKKWFDTDEPALDESYGGAYNVDEQYLYDVDGGDEPFDDVVGENTGFFRARSPDKNPRLTAPNSNPSPWSTGSSSPSPRSVVVPAGNGQRPWSSPSASSYYPSGSVGHAHGGNKLFDEDDPMLDASYGGAYNVDEQYLNDVDGEDEPFDDAVDENTGFFMTNRARSSNTNTGYNTSPGSPRSTGNSSPPGSGVVPAGNGQRPRSSTHRPGTVGSIKQGNKQWFDADEPTLDASYGGAYNGDQQYLNDVDGEDEPFDDAVDENYNYSGRNLASSSSTGNSSPPNGIVARNGVSPLPGRSSNYLRGSTKVSRHSFNDEQQDRSALDVVYGAAHDGDDEYFDDVDSEGEQFDEAKG